MGNMARPSERLLVDLEAVLLGLVRVCFDVQVTHDRICVTVDIHPPSLAYLGRIVVALAPMEKHVFHKPRLIIAESPVAMVYKAGMATVRCAGDDIPIVRYATVCWMRNTEGLESKMVT